MPKKKIEGKVTDRAGDPLPRIWVRAYRNNIEIGSEVSGDDGKYQFNFDSGGPISIFRFDSLDPQVLNRWHPSVTFNIPGDNDLVINKVLPGKVGTHLAFFELLEIISAYEVCYALDNKIEYSPNTIREDIAQWYKVNLDMVKHLDEYTQGRLQSIKSLSWP